MGVPDYCELVEKAKHNALAAIAKSADASRVGDYDEASRRADEARNWFLNAAAWKELQKGGCA